MALFTIQKGKPAIIFEQRFRTQEWTSLTEMIRFFCNGNSYPERMCISFAGPVKDGRAKGTNIEWTVDSHVLSMELGIPHVHLINDLEANCYGLAALTKTDFKVIYPGLKSHPQHELMKTMMNTEFGFGGLFVVDLKTPERANELMEMMQEENVGYLAVSLGSYKSLFSAPGGSTSSEIPEEEREAMGLTDGLVRISIGLDNDAERTYQTIKSCLNRVDK